MSEIIDYDVVIVGGGVVGLTLACALQNCSLRIALIDNQQPKAIALGADYDIRVSAISHASQHVFTNLQVWSRMVALRVNPYREMHVWDGRGRGAIHFNCTEIAENNLGFIIENQVMQASLYEQLQTNAQVDFIFSNSPQTLLSSEQVVTLTLQDGKTLSTKLLVGADGGQSWVRAQTGIKIVSWDYGHHALIATVKTELLHQATAWQCFLADGPLAFLPLSSQQFCSIVWSVPPAQAERLLALPTADFNRELTSAFEFRLGHVELVSQRLSFPLQMRHAKHYVSHRIALIGDAAHTIHPLAGQGVNLGILDAACLAETILMQVQKRDDIGDFFALRRYERWRKGHNVGVIALMESLKRLFSNQLSGVQWLRSLGLNLTDRILPVKKLLMRQALGRSRDLPSLAQVRE